MSSSHPTPLSPRKANSSETQDLSSIKRAIGDGYFAPKLQRSTEEADALKAAKIAAEEAKTEALRQAVVQLSKTEVECKILSHRVRRGGKVVGGTLVPVRQCTKMVAEAALTWTPTSDDKANYTRNLEIIAESDGLLELKAVACCDVHRTAESQRMAKGNAGKVRTKLSAEAAAANNAQTNARQKEVRSIHREIASRGDPQPLTHHRTEQQLRAIAATIVSSDPISSLRGTQASILISATARPPFGTPPEKFLSQVRTECMMSFTARGDGGLPKIVTSNGRLASSTITQSKAAEVHILAIGDRANEVTGPTGIEGYIIDLLLKANPEHATSLRVINKSAIAPGCGLNPNHFMVVTAMIFREGLEALNLHVQNNGRVQAHVWSDTALALPASPAALVFPGPHETWRTGAPMRNEDMIHAMNLAYRGRLL